MQSLTDNLTRVAILASGNGSNAENIMALQTELGIKVCCIITDKKNAGVIEKAKKYRVKTYLVERSKKEIQEAKIVEILKELEVEWIFLAGYMKILSKFILDKFYDSKLGASKIINIHPSLLPLFPGANAYEQTYRSEAEVSGVTVHFVDEGMDTGPIILQESFKRNSDDSFDEFCKKGLELEWKIYPKAIQIVLNGSFKKMEGCI